MRTWTPFIMAVVVATFCAGCAMRKTAQQAPPAGEPPALRALGAPVAPMEEISDETIGAEIRRRFELMGAAAMVSVVIEVNERVVTLRGVAPDRAAAWRAEAAARSVAGVKEVQNQIIVRSQ